MLKVFTELSGTSPVVRDHTVRAPCHSTQVNAPRLNPSQAGQYSIYLPHGDGGPGWLVIYRDDSSVRRQSPIQTRRTATSLSETKALSLPLDQTTSVLEK